MASYLELRNGGRSLVDDGDFESLKSFMWRKHTNDYVIRSVWKKNRNHTVYLHRQLMSPPIGSVVDHINGNRLDNRRTNLRVCDQNQNLRNSNKKAGRKFKGVYWDKINRNHRASITTFAQTIHLGSFQSPQDAAIAYDAAARELYGEFAKPNFP